MKQKNTALTPPKFEEFQSTVEDATAMMAYLASFFRVANPAFEEASRPRLTTSVYRRPKIIQHQLKLSDRSYYVKEGMVFAFYYNSNNEIVPFRLFFADEIAQIPESFNIGKPAAYNLMACNNTRLVDINLSNLHEIFAEFPEAPLQTLQVVSNIFEKDRIKDQMQNLGKKESILKFYQCYPHLYGNKTFWFRDKYVAHFLHISPITFSKLKRKLFKNGLPGQI